jgi:hypothetical protein
MTEKFKIRKNNIQTLINEEISKFEMRPKLEDMAGGLGNEADRHIDYSPKEEMSGKKSEFKLKEPIPELLQYLSELENARSILSRVAANHKDEEVKKRVYNHYDKCHKLGLEMIKEFGIVH